MRAFPILLGLCLVGARSEPAQTCGTHCGTERWPVKTLTDADRASVNLTPTTTTVANLLSLVPPASLPANARVAPTERTTFRVQAVLIGWKLEGDRDMHLVIADPGAPTQTMIVEVPSTTCDHVCNSGHVTEFRAARRALIAKFRTPTSHFHAFSTPRPITVTGVGFFDVLHGQTGVAPNGIALHPVLKVGF
jgi:hypothetical protein